MPKEISSTELNAVFQAVAAVPRPASLEQIAGELPRSLARRTLQRRLAQLVAENRLIAIGTRAGRRYQAPEYSARRLPELPLASDAAVSFVSEPAAGFASIQLSDAAKEIKWLVNRPLMQRKPVGYVFSFLDGYRPNVSAYLSPTLRKK